MYIYLYDMYIYISIYMIYYGSRYSRIYSGKSGGAMWYIVEGGGGPTGYPVSLGLYFMSAFNVTPRHVSRPRIVV